MPISGSPTQVATSVTNAAALRAIISAQFKKGEVALLSAPPAGSPTPFYNLNPTSTMFDDGVTAIAALDGGMWERADFFVPGSATLVVATSTALPNPATLGDAVLAYVQSQRAWYRVEQHTWQRLPVTDPSWQQQTAWFIDATNGNDDNAGGNGAGTAGPLQTLLELRNRLYQGVRAPIIAKVTVTIVGQTFSEDFIFAAHLFSGGMLTFQGTRTGVSNRAWTAFQNRVASTNTDNRGTDAGGVQGANVGKLIFDTTAAPNTAAWIMRDLGGGVAQLSSFITFNSATTALVGAEVAPGGTDTYQIVSPTSLTGFIEVDVDGPLEVTVNAGKFVMDSFALAPTSGTGTITSRGVLAYLAHCSNSSVTTVGVQLQNVLAAGTFGFSAVAPQDAALFINGGGAIGCNTVFSNAGSISMDMGYLVAASASNNGVIVRGASQLVISAGGLGVFNCTGSPLQHERGGVASFVGLAALWGVNAAANNKINVLQGQMLNELGNTWVLCAPITAASNNLGSANANSGAVYAIDPATGAPTAARALTLALLDATIAGGGFAGNYSNPRAFSIYNRTSVA